MSDWKRVCSVGDVPPGTGRHIMGPRNKPMALFNAGGTFYAINYVCPHMGGPLGEGKLDGCIVTCPWHGWTFDVRTGQADHEGGHAVAAYEVKVDQDAIWVGWLKPAGPR